MTSKGKYPKGVAKQEELVDVALNIVAQRGYSGATIREVAEAAGLSKTGLLHHFSKKDDLFVEVLRRRDDLAAAKWQRERDQPSMHSAELISGFVRENANVPGLVQLFTRLSSEATDSTHPAHDFFRQRYEQNEVAAAGLFEEMRERGELPEEVDPHMLAVIVAALQDGLQLRWLYEPSVDMAAHIRHFFQAMAIPVAEEANFSPPPS